MGCTMTAMHTCAVVQPHIDERGYSTHASTVHGLAYFHVPSWAEPVLSRVVKISGVVSVQAKLSTSSYA
eukprot:3936870-Rhodomonas_salina.1